ncbi:MAG: hypothetical protein O2973_13810 [Gemmatimonadetes bacterium]|nr:hypothetical protein [Gemmatimonadota bacterium]
MFATLALAAACDKAPAADSSETLPQGVTPIDLASKPTILFHVFGSVDSSKIMPIAAIVDGAIQPIALTRAGWRELDSTYLAAGTTYSLYTNDDVSGSVTVSRGMWAGQTEALYPLPGCRDLRPLGAGSLNLPSRRTEPSIEFIASSAPLAPHPSVTRSLPPSATVGRIGREYGTALGLANSMDKQELDSLDFIARMLITGAGREPTLLVSYIDQQAGDVAPGVGNTSHILALFDKVDTGYVSTYRHVKSGDATGVEFQRLVDHLDVDGDGIDEIILESWHYASSNELVVLAFKAGRWHEVLRSGSNWCLDPPKPDK